MTIQQILDLIASTSGQPSDKIHSKDRSRQFLIPRQIMMYIMRTKLKMKLKDIGIYFLMDHTSVLHSINKVHELLEVEDQLLIHLYDLIDYNYRMESKESIKVIVRFNDKQINSIDLAKIMLDMASRYNCVVEKI